MLDGVFSEENEDYWSGMYIGIPSSSEHWPHSEFGWVILAKLFQMLEDDQTVVRVDTRATNWFHGRVDGLIVLPCINFLPRMLPWHRGTVALWRMWTVF